jgi:hypothetical protein
LPGKDDEHGIEHRSTVYASTVKRVAFDCAQ